MTTTTGDGDGDMTTGDGDGDMTTGDGDGDMTTGDGDGDMTTGDGDGDMTGDGDGDMTGDGDGDPLQLPAWLLSIDETDATTDRLIRISIDDNDFGTVTEICADITWPQGIPAGTNITSLTFNANTLFASIQDDQVGDTLAIVDPCTCEGTVVGKYGNFSSVNGITSNEAQEMFGVAVTQDVIIDIDPFSAQSMVLLDLNANWGSTGLTWSQPQDNVLYGINATTDRLHTFSGDGMSDLGSIQLDGNFNSVGIELHPTFDTLYACGISGDQRSLFTVDVDSGAVVKVANNVWAANCDNIAAPFGPVDCVPQ